jgi:hypothetical protein
MKKKPLDQNIDCLELKRRAQERILEQIRGMTPDEEIEYFRHAAETGSLGALWKSLPVDAVSQALSDNAA